jgi:ribosomal protein L37E
MKILEYSSIFELYQQLNCVEHNDIRQQMINLFKRWKPKGKMYSLRCSQCGSGFLSSYDLEAPICSKCLQKAKSLDSTIDSEKVCRKCGKNGVIYGKQECHSCYFGFEKKESSR